MHASTSNLEWQGSKLVARAQIGTGTSLGAATSPTSNGRRPGEPSRASAGIVSHPTRHALQMLHSSRKQLFPMQASRTSLPLADRDMRAMRSGLPIRMAAEAASSATDRILSLHGTLLPLLCACPLGRPPLSLSLSHRLCLLSALCAALRAVSHSGP